MKKIFAFIAVTIVSTACANSENTSGSAQDAATGSAAKDITNAIFTKSAISCADYANEYQSDVKDVNEKTDFKGSLKITLKDDQCVFATNAIPNHYFNDGASTFVHKVTAQDLSYTIPQTPSMTPEATALSLRTDNAIFLNGVKLDLLSAGCFGIGNGFIGCFDAAHPFRYDPMSPLNDFGTDSHNAHAQPDGTYHYHGNPLAMFTADTKKASPVIGFAADGFPIYGSYFDDNGTIRKAKSSYALKDNGGPRKSADFEGKTLNPGGNYDGTYTDDYVYDAANGDLDECNGMTVNGSYGYYVTDAYPWVLNCFKGTPDKSFNKQPPSGTRPPGSES